MATFPDYAKLLLSGVTDSFDASVSRTEMERGMPKQRRKNKRVLRKISCTVMFQSSEHVQQFEDWYFNTIGRIGFFDVKHPRTGVLTSMRFESGQIGELTPQASGFAISSRDVVLEYLG